MGTYYGTTGNDVLKPMSSADDYMFGDAGNDIIYGWYGNDTLNGWTGNDSLHGEAGNDTLSGAGGDDYMNGGVGDDTVDYTYWNGGGTYNLATGVASFPGFYNEEIFNFENILTGSGNDNVIGSEANNRIITGSGNDKLFGAGGDDYINGGLGIDSLYGGTGNDTYIIDSTTDTITEYVNQGKDKVQSSVSYTLGANLENLTLTGFSAISGTGNTQHNVITGNVANNYVYANDGNDIVYAGAGNDYVNGGTGNDPLYGEAGNDTLVGYYGDDYLNGDIGHDSLYGQVGNDLLLGYYGNDSLRGGSGNDTIKGEADSDTLVGGYGQDALHGGSGADKFHFNYVSEGNDVIKDFQWTEGDKIQIYKSGFDATSTGQFRYSSSTGALSFDKSPFDLAGPVQFATLENKPSGFSTSLNISLVDFAIA